MGEIPLLSLPPGATGEPACRAAVQTLSRMASGHEANPLAGGLLYVPDPATYGLCREEGGEVAELLRSRRILPVDAPGLAAVLASLRLSFGTRKVLSAVEEALRSVAPLKGQSERLSAPLAALNAESLRTRVRFEEKP
jgi:hypothetical protein